MTPLWLATMYGDYTNAVLGVDMSRNSAVLAQSSNSFIYRSSMSLVIKQDDFVCLGRRQSCDDIFMAAEHLHIPNDQNNCGRWHVITFAWYPLLHTK